MNAKEESFYHPIMQAFTRLFESKAYKAHLEITANRKFSNKLKSKISDSRHIIFYFLKDIAPDITGFIVKDNWLDFVGIEVKNEEIKLDHIYQTRKYADLFSAKFAFLVSTVEISQEIKSLAKIAYPLLSAPSIYESRVLVYFDEETNTFKDWYPENPFEEGRFWH